MRKAFHGFSTTITTHKEKKKKKKLSLFTKNDFSTLDFQHVDIIDNNILLYVNT